MEKIERLRCEKLYDRLMDADRAARLIEDGMTVDCRIRYRNQGTPARLYREDEGLRVEFDTPVESVTPGQSAVFYEGDDVVGGGIIC